MILNSPTISGSLTVTGNIIASGSITLSGSVASASYAATASFVALAQSASYVLTAQTASFVANAQTASFVALAQSASNAVSAQTASFANAFTVASTLTAQTLVVQTITSSVDFVTGSTRFGSSLSTSTHQFTGSVSITGSLDVITTGTEFQVTSTGVKFGNVIGDAHSITGSVGISGSVLIGSTSAAGTEKFGVTKDDGVTDGLHIIADFNRSGSLSAELILGYYASGSAVTGPVVYAANSQPLLFGAGSVERMRLDANGNLLLTAISPKNPDAYDSNRTFLTVQAKTGGSDRGAFMTLVGTAGGSPNYWIGRYAFASTTATYNHASIISFTDSGGVYSGNLIFTTNANASTGDATERMRITSAGQIGVNTSSPVTTSLTGSITIYKAYNADQASVPSTTAQAYYGTQHGLYLFGRNSGLTIVSANSEEGSIKFANASTSVYATIGTTTGTSAVGGDMIFRVGSDTERMRITSGGNVSIGNTQGNSNFTVSEYVTGNPTRELNINCATSGLIRLFAYNRNAGGIPLALNDPGGNVLIGNTTDYGYKLSVAGSNGMYITGGSSSAHTPFIVQSASGADFFKIRGDGYLQSVSTYNNTTASPNYLSISTSGFFERYVASSQRYKEEIKDWDVNGLDIILALRPRTYKYKKEYYNKADVDFLGLIAEEVAEVNTYLADYENEDGTGQVENVRYATIVVPLIKAIQELKTQNDALQSRIETLESK
jgi:hypothetical protein